MREWFARLEGEFIFHCEDDWEFIARDEILTHALTVLKAKPRIGQVGISNKTLNEPILYADGVEYWTYPYNRRPFVHGQQRSWPHFTLNPSVIRVAAIKRVGNFSEMSNFEFRYGLRWLSAGFRTAFLNRKYVVHIGNEKSAYSLNHTGR
jgi:hypothetical protein